MGLIPKRGMHYRKPALWKRILKWTILSLLVIILSVGIAGFIFVYHTLGKIGIDTEVVYEARQQLDVPLPAEPESDFVRSGREQLFSNDAKAQSMKWGNLTKIPELADVFASNTTSDIGRSDVLSLTKFIMGLSRDRIYQIQAPVNENAGGPAGEYVAIAKQAFSSTIEQFVSPAFEKPEPQVPGAAIAQVPSENTKKLSFEILNGNGVEGAATVAANLLRQKGCTSVEIGGNANNSYVENQIYFREGNQAAADELSTLFKPAVVSPIPPELNTKAQILVAVGTGFEGQLTEKQPEVKAALHFEQDSETNRRSWQAASLKLPFPVQKPASFPAEFDYVDFHNYEIQTDDGPRPALKVVA